MIEPVTLPFLVFASTVIVSPGPSNVLLLAVGVQAGWVRGLPLLLGMAVGYAFLWAALAVGFGLFAETSAQIVNVMRYAGLVFIAWMAWQIASGELDRHSGAPSSYGGLLQGILFQFANSKAWVTGAIATTAFSVPGWSPAAHALAFAIALFPTVLIGLGVWLVAGSVIARLLASPRVLRAFNYSMASLLLASFVGVIL